MFLAQRPAASEEPTDTEPTCEGDITGYEEGPYHCCQRNTCFHIPRVANGRTYFYSSSGCIWIFHHHTIGACGCW